MARDTQYSAFGALVRKELTKAQTTQNMLAERTDASPAYINNMMTGRKTPPPEWVDLIASALNLEGNRRTKLHRAAAKDAGYDIDLTKP
jgi:hypothetical protein